MEARKQPKDILFSFDFLYEVQHRSKSSPDSSQFIDDNKN